MNSTRSNSVTSPPSSSFGDRMQPHSAADSADADNDNNTVHYPDRRCTTTVAGCCCCGSEIDGRHCAAEDRCCSTNGASEAAVCAVAAAGTGIASAVAATAAEPTSSSVFDNSRRLSDCSANCRSRGGKNSHSTIRKTTDENYDGVVGDDDLLTTCSTSPSAAVAVTTTKSSAAKFRYMNSRAKANQAYVPTDIEHLANVVTHALWIAPSIAGLYWMTSVSTGLLQHVSAVVYGLSLFCLFTVSTTFHALAYCGRFRELQTFFHIGDRAVIYIFIASSYTPWLALKDFHRCGLLMLFIVWIAAVLGIVYQYTFHERYKWLETLLYIIVGMAPAVIVFEMKEVSGLYELMIGGVVYVVGVVFFKCDGVIPFAHAIWHSFVFVGAMLHFVAVCRYLLGPNNSNVLALSDVILSAASRSTAPEQFA